MPTKWLDMAFGNEKEDAPNGKALAASLPSSTAPSETTPVQAVRANPNEECLAKSFADMPPLEDIYRAAGIKSPPMGYGISKVIEMLRASTSGDYQAMRSVRQS